MKFPNSSCISKKAASASISVISNSQQLHRPDQRDCQHARCSSQDSSSVVQGLITLPPSRICGAEHSPGATVGGFSMSLPNSLAAAGSCCKPRFSKCVIAANHRSCILRESRLLVGWHCHHVSSYRLHCQPALHAAPGHAASTQLPTLSQYSLVPPHCP